MWNPKMVQGLAWKFGLAAVTVGLMAGCGGSSSSEGSNGGGETTTLSNEEAAAVAIASIGGAENYRNLSLAFAPDDVDFDGDQMEEATVLATQAGLKVKELEAQQTEACESGSVTFNDTDSGFVVEWNQCKVSGFTGDGGEFYMDGVTTFAQGPSPRTDFTDLLKVNYDDFEMDVSLSNGDRFAMSLDGSLAIHSHASPRRTLAVFDFGAMSSVECGGISDQFDALMDVSIRADDIGDGTDMEVNGRVENDGARVDVETTRTIYTPDGTIYPEDGVFVATHGGSTTTVEFVESGLNVNGTFYTWDEFEEEYLAEEENPAFSQCGV